VKVVKTVRLLGIVRQHKLLEGESGMLHDRFVQNKSGAGVVQVTQSK